jgi:hypothetical protein
MYTFLLCTYTSTVSAVTLIHQHCLCFYTNTCTSTDSALTLSLKLAQRFLDKGGAEKITMQVCRKWNDLSMLERKQTVQVLFYSWRESDFLVLLSGDIHKNIQNTTEALENSGKPWAISFVAGISWWKRTVQLTSTQNFSCCLTRCIISRYYKAWVVKVVYSPDSKNRDCCLHSDSFAAQPTTWHGF